MTEQEVSKLFEQYFKEIMSTRDSGQKEYAQTGNAFANFERLAKDLGITREKILWVYAMKHRDGIASYLNGHTSQREDVRGRIKDLVVYLFLLWSMLDESKVNSQGTAYDYPSNEDRKALEHINKISAGLWAAVCE